MRVLAVVMVGVAVPVGMAAFCAAVGMGALGILVIVAG